MEELESFVTGFYAGESDLESSPDRPRALLSAQEVGAAGRDPERYDPDHRKWGYLSED